MTEYRGNKVVLDYGKSQIFKLTSPKTDKVYIGGTVDTLKMRFDNHLKEYMMKKPNQGPNFPIPS